MTTAKTLTILQIRTLRDEAIAAGDPVLRDMCAIALSNRDSDGTGTTLGTPCTVADAIYEILEVINHAEAQS